MVNQKVRSIFAVLVVFTIGFVAHALVDTILTDDTQHFPLSFPITDNDKDSPHYLVNDGHIHVFSNKFIVDGFDDLQWASLACTKSMDPVFDCEANVIEVIPKSPDDIELGDIISYKSKYASGTIIHRVVDKGVDEDGVFFILKGDNNKNADPGKVRFKQVERQVVAVIY